MTPLVSIKFTVVDRSPTHTHLSVWAGSAQSGDPHSITRAYAGDIILRNDEWDALRAFIDYDDWPMSVFTPDATRLRLDRGTDTTRSRLDRGDTR